MTYPRAAAALSRVRRPRVHLTYDVEIAGAIEQRELPFVVGVLGDFSGQPAEPLPRIRDRKFVQIDADNFNQVLAGMKPRVTFRVPNRLLDDDSQFGVELNFRHLDEFEPAAVVRQVPALDALLNVRRHLADLHNTMAANERVENELADVWFDAGRQAAMRQEFETPGDEPPQAIGEMAVRAFGPGAEPRLTEMLQIAVRELLDGHVAPARDIGAALLSRVAQLDQRISTQLDEILHHPAFQRLEGSWRGLAYLVRNTETSDRLKIKVLNASKRDAARDLERAPEFDLSTLFKKIYEEEFGVFGGEPFSVLIGDYDITQHPQDIAFLERMSNIAASAHAPFIASADAHLLSLGSFQELGQPRDLAKIFQMYEYAKWQAFRASEDAQYVALVLPRMLMRLPYGRDTNPVSDFNYEENATGTLHHNYLWSSAIYGLASRLTNAFATFGWTAAIRGVEGGGIVSDLPVHTFRTDDGDQAAKCPTEVAITDRREKELAELGFIPLVHCKGTDFACFFSAQSCHQPSRYEQAGANASARAAAQLPYVLALSRFAHYFKAMMRDKIGSFSSRAETESFLNRWVVQYVTLDDAATTSTLARFPLKSARVEVVEVRGSPGSYRAVAFLLPNFQLEQLSVPLRVVMTLPQALY